ncbi:hypothetical protein K502DRAFT_350970 [Neoconidiobolus thromboides FSU 785]|nr:hypothetical protein K502DRAFT_350970 [Neoconidiobolus thromboides FSU 785]
MKLTIISTLLFSTLTLAATTDLTCDIVGNELKGICTKLGEEKSKPVLAEIAKCASSCKDEVCKQTCVKTIFLQKLDLKEIALLKRCLEEGKSDHKKAVECTSVSEKVIEETYNCTKKCNNDETCKFMCGTKVYEARMDNVKEDSKDTSSSKSSSNAVAFCYSPLALAAFGLLFLSN